MWTWADVLKLAITTGFSTASFNQGFGLIKEAIQRAKEDRKKGTVSALGLVKILQNYAQECHYRLKSNRFDQSDTPAGWGLFSEMPELPQYPDQTAWEVLPSKMAASINDFRHELTTATQGIQFTDDVLGPPEAIDTANYTYIRMGHKAAELARQLRNHYNLGRYSPDFILELREEYRKSRRGSPFLRIWRSRTATKLRRRCRRYFLNVRHLVTLGR